MHQSLSKAGPKVVEERAFSKAAFTLVELLVSIAVLALIVILVAQLTNSSATITKNSTKHMDADSQARVIFSRMALEFSKMLKRSDIDFSTFKQPSNPQIGNDQFAFYAETTGTYPSTAPTPSTTDKAQVSLIAYNVAVDPYNGQTVLRRMTKGLGWDPADATSTSAWMNVVYLPATLITKWPTLFGTDPDYRSVGDQVFRVEYSYLLKPTATQPGRISITPWDTTTNPPHTTIDGFKDVAAIVMTIAVLDSTSRIILSNAQYIGVANTLADAQDNRDTKTTWSGVVNSGSFAATAGIPSAAASAVRIYERSFYLDPL